MNEAALHMINQAILQRKTVSPLTAAPTDPWTDIHAGLEARGTKEGSTKLKN